MTFEEVVELVRLQAGEGSMGANDHRITLKQALVPPKWISVIFQMVQRGRVTEQELKVWLVGKEGPAGGYMIVLRDDGLQFGLASPGFPADKHPALVGWYGSLESAFMAM